MGRYDHGGKPKKERSYEPAFRFIDYSLVKSDEDWLRKADLAAEFPYSQSDDLVTQGYKISRSYDTRNQCFIFAATDRDPASPSYNACLTGRGATLLDSWYAFAYRHYIVAAEDWTSLENKSKDAPPPQWG